MFKKDHSSCFHYAPIDAAKGICRRKKIIVEAEKKECDNFKRLPRCYSCNYFLRPDNNSIGTCMGFEKTHWISGDMSAVSCKRYELSSNFPA